MARGPMRNAPGQQVVTDRTIIDYHVRGDQT